jgi:hypothetical protein
MSDKRDFYIGWQEEMPKSYRAFLQKRMLFIVLLIPVIALSLVLAQRYFKKGTFQVGIITELTGTYVSEPVPILLDVSLSADGEPQDILIVGYGKFGAEGIVHEIEKEAGQLEGKQVTFAGTLVTGGDKTVLELTMEEESLVSISDEIILSPSLVIVDSLAFLSGEILDPKCYFGAMKPGEGKIHKSCAIRCISGGIPPVFRSGEEGSFEYYILRDRDGKACNKEILDFVGEQVVITGSNYKLSSWNVLNAQVESIEPKE